MRPLPSPMTPEIKGHAREALIRAGDRADSLARPERRNATSHRRPGLQTCPARARACSTGGLLGRDAATTTRPSACSPSPSRSTTPRRPMRRHACRGDWRTSSATRQPRRGRSGGARFETSPEDEPDEDLASLAAFLGGAYVFQGEHERGQRATGIRPRRGRIARAAAASPAFRPRASLPQPGPPRKRWLSQARPGDRARA